MNTIWVLAGESSRATIYSMGSRTSGLEEVECFANPAARQHEQDLTSDLPGQGFDGKGAGRHSLNPKGSKKDREALDFAKVLCAHLEDARVQGRYKQLVICASPHFLGLVRQNLNASTSSCVIAEIDKNMVKASPEELAGLVHDELSG